MLWFAWKFVPLWYQQQRLIIIRLTNVSCDLLENSYLCGISNNCVECGSAFNSVVICLKIRTFVVSATTLSVATIWWLMLWFAWKFVPLWYQQQLVLTCHIASLVVICLKIRTFVVSATTYWENRKQQHLLWFAWKFVPLWYQQQPHPFRRFFLYVVICLKIRTFVVSATTHCNRCNGKGKLWFAWKFVPLWYQQQPACSTRILSRCCDLLENSYLCGISNNVAYKKAADDYVVICLKIRTFVVSATTRRVEFNFLTLLWFAWKFVPLWYQQQPTFTVFSWDICCDLLENSYLCGISNNDI